MPCQHPYEQDWLPWHLPYLQQVGAQVGFVGQAGWPEALGSIYKVGCIGSVYKVESDCVSASGLHKHVHMNTRVPGHTCTHTCQNQSFAFSLPCAHITGIWAFFSQKVLIFRITFVYLRVCGGQRKLVDGLISPSTVWVWGLELILSGLMVSNFSC